MKGRSVKRLGLEKTDTIEDLRTSEKTQNEWGLFYHDVLLLLHCGAIQIFVEYYC